jgi:tetratricopeptide (TPR) repeat protein
MARGDVFWGEILNPNKVLLTRGSPEGKIMLRWITPSSGTVRQEQLTLEGKEVKAVHLAKTLRNEVARRMLDVTDEVANLGTRTEMIDWLLEQATREGWAYEEAIKLAEGYAKISGKGGDPIDGYRVVARVLRAAGRLNQEWQLYQTLPADVADTPFRWAGQGSIEALLGLDALAEQHLRQAIARGNDPRAAVALADFLVSRGQAVAAVPIAQLAYKDRNVLTRPDEQLALKRCLIAVYLANGMLEDGRNVAGTLPNNALALRGAVAYAAGEAEFAAGQFRGAAENNDMPGLAALGSAACAARAGKWQEAASAFLALADRDPMLRARALGGVAFVLERTGNYEAAASRLQDALVVDPTDAYLAYLRGRVLRLAGDLDGAAEQLGQALRKRDDLVEAMVELAETYLRIAERDEGRAIESLDRAKRYIDRCIALETQWHGQPTPRFLELQALVRWRNGDWRGARAAFLAAQQAGSTYGQVGLALVEYAQGRTDVARDQLADLDKRPLGDPFRDYGTKTLALINDHAEKVEIRDDFERDEIGDRWKVFSTSRTALRPTLDGGRLAVRAKVESQDATARRVLEAAGDFVAAEVIFERGRPDESDRAGLRLVVGREDKNPEFQAFLGYTALANGVVPALQIQDGNKASATPQEAAKFEPRPLAVASTSGPQHLLLELLPDGGDGLLLRASWNNRVVGEEKITRVRRGTRLPMNVDLHVAGRHGQVNVTFDKFRLRLRQRP